MTEAERYKGACVLRIVDDDAALRDALSFFLTVEGWKCVTYADPALFLRDDDPSVPGCAIVDLKMPEMDGLTLQALYRKRHPAALPFIFLSAHGDIDSAVSAIQGGATDFLQKPVDETRLLKTILRALEGAAAKPANAPSREKTLETLTARELTVARLIAQGLSHRAVAERLGLSVRTVEAHRANVARKLGDASPTTLAELFHDIP